MEQLLATEKLNQSGVYRGGYFEKGLNFHPQKYIIPHIIFMTSDLIYTVRLYNKKKSWTYSLAAVHNLVKEKRCSDNAFTFHI